MMTISNISVHIAEKKKQRINLVEIEFPRICLISKRNQTTNYKTVKS